MLNAAMVLMILAGIFGLPAVACSGCVAEIAATGDKGANQVHGFLGNISMLAAFGSIAVGSLARKLGKRRSGLCCFIFAGMFALLMIQLNFLGLVSSIMLVVAGVMILVAPEEQFRSVTRVETVPPGR